MKRAIPVVFSIILMPLVQAADFSVKGFELGRKAEEFYQFLDCDYKNDGLVTCKNRDNSLTIGGEIVTLARVEFNEQKLSTSVVLGFKPESYLGIKSAVISKYPKTQCRKSEIVTNAGGHIPTETCTIGTRTEVLMIQAHSWTIEQGSLSLLSAEALRDSVKNTRVKRKDI